MINSVLKWFKKNKIHFLVWTIFILYESIVIGLAFNRYSHPFTYIIHNGIIIVFFYVHADFLMPWATKDRIGVVWKLPLFGTLLLGIYIVLHYCADLLLIYTNIIKWPGPYKLDQAFFLKNLYRGIYFMGFSTGYYYIQTYLKERKKTEKLETERLNNIILQQRIEQDLVKAQNAFLKAQINPHFLFNTLDFVYHHVNAQSPMAGDAIIRLSQMMRYAIDSDQVDVHLGDEIEQVENLIYLNQVRKSKALNLEFSYTDEVKDLRLIPLVLLTLVENIFKHGDLSDPAHQAQINVAAVEDTFYLETDNLINSKASSISNNSGLLNIKKRLQYAYGDETDFTYGIEDQNHFVVRLFIPLVKLKAPVLSAMPSSDNDK